MHKDLSISSMAEVDRPRIRIGVFAKSSADNALTALIKNVQLVQLPSIAELYALLSPGKAVVLAVARTGPYLEALRNPGSRVLDGSFREEPIAMGVRRRREAAVHAFMSQYVEGEG